MSDAGLVISKEQLKDVLADVECDKTEEGSFIIEGVLDWGVGGNWPVIGANAVYQHKDEDKPLLPAVREYVVRKNAEQADLHTDHSPT